MESSYWNHKGKYQKAADALNKLVPEEGEVDSAHPHLEKFRKASNCYYDTFNNGLCNRRSEFRSIFKNVVVVSRGRGTGYYDIDMQNWILLDKEMDAIILHAAAEQGVDVI